MANPLKSAGRESIPEKSKKKKRKYWNQFTSGEKELGREVSSRGAGDKNRKIENENQEETGKVGRSP